MKNVLVVCGAGMGTSLMMKMKLTQFAEAEGLDIMVESCGLDEGQSSLRDYDIVVCAKHLVDDLGTIPATTQVIAVNNLMDVSSYGNKVKELAEE